MGVGAAVASVAHGATVIEKHFTLSRADGGVDSAFSMEPEEMRSLVIETERAWQSLGHIKYGIIDAATATNCFGETSIYSTVSGLDKIKLSDFLQETSSSLKRPFLSI